MILKDSNPTGANLLTEEEARLRSKLVRYPLPRFHSLQRNVSYNLNLRLLPNTEGYSGDLRIKFDANVEKIKNEPNIFFDFVGDEITMVSLNGTEGAIAADPS